MNEELPELPELPEGFCYATTEELALALGSTDSEAKAVQARIERLSGNIPKLIEVDNT